MTITILLVDDHHLVRQGIRTLLESEPELVVVGEASNGVECVQMVEKYKPQVVVLDLMLPGINGLEVTRQVSEKTRVLILSMHSNEAYVLEALQKGAYGYVLKDSTAEELIQAVQEVARGKRYLSPPFSEHAIAAYMQKAQSMVTDPYETLSRREREVLHMVAAGYSNNDISSALSISPRTVEGHRSNIMHKLNLQSQADLIRFAIRRGILPLED
ncbi:MAG: response regulator transcription factor [Anaerolineaceae bacterium]|jgi:DNA-binding NarL/FixJ family response regulator